MSTATTANILTECNLPKVATSILTPYLATATIELERLLTVDAAGDRYTLLATPTSPYDSADKAILVKAEALLAGSIALPFLNLKTQGDGIVGSTGFAESRTELLSPLQIQATAVQWRRDAMNLLAPYIPDVNDNENGDRTASSPTMRIGSRVFVACGGS